MKINKKTLVLLLLLLLWSSLNAQYGSLGSSSSRSSGMALTANAVSRGVNSIGINPANLAKNENYTVDISTLLPLPRLNIHTGTDFISIDEINYYFGGVNGEARFLTGEDKERLYNLFEDGGLFTGQVNTNLFSINVAAGKNIGSIAFAISDAVSASINFPQEIVNIALNGNTSGKDYSLNDAEIKSWWIRNYSLSYARKLTGFGAFSDAGLYSGITFKLVHGFYYFGTDKVNTVFQTGNSNEITGDSEVKSLAAFSENFGVKYKFEEEDRSSNFSPFPSPAGSGFGVDLGLAAILKNGLHLSFAVTDIGSIKWDKHTAEISYSGQIFLDDLTSSSQRDSIKNQLLGESKKIDNFSTQLPTALRIGAAYKFGANNFTFPGSLLLAMDFNEGFNKAPGNSTKPRLSIGAEWKPMDWIPYLRSGFSIGGLHGFRWSFGIGIDTKILELNIATTDFQSMVAPNSAKYISVSIDSRWKF